MSLPKLVILDRDGVINHDSDNYIKSPEEWIPISGSLEAIARLNQLGCKVAVATNQSGIFRGFYGEDVLQQMHEKMHRLLADVGGHVDLIRYCPHGPDDGCTCRKPKPGMLLDALEYFGIAKTGAVFVGDTFSDLNAAGKAGVDFVMVKTGKGARILAEHCGKNLTASVYENLAAYVDTLMS